MKQIKFNKKYRSGFTLLELVIVMAVIGILSGLAVWQSQEYVPRMRTRQGAKQFAKNVDFMRMSALKTNRESRICMIEYDSAPNSITSANKGKYTLSLGNKSLNSDDWDLMPEDHYDNGIDDEDGFGTIDHSAGAKQYLRHVSIDEWSEDIGGPHVGNADCIVFSPRGYVMNPASDFNAQGFIEITFVNKYARSISEKQDHIVMVARSGFTRIDISQARLNDAYFSGTDYDASEN